MARLIPPLAHGVLWDPTRASHLPPSNLHPLKTSGPRNGASKRLPDYFEYRYHIIFILYTYFPAHIYSLPNIQVQFIIIPTISSLHHTILSIYLHHSLILEFRIYFCFIRDLLILFQIFDFLFLFLF